MNVTVAVLDKTDKNSVQAAVLAMAETIPENMQSKYGFRVATTSKITTTQDTKALLSQREKSITAIGSASTSKNYQTKILKNKDSVIALDGTVYSPQPKNAVINCLASKLYDNPNETALEFLRNVEGDYSILFAQTKTLLAARDPVGVQPLYYGENQALAAFALNRKTLWALGITEPKSFPPGHVGIASKEGFRFKPFQTLTFAESKPLDMADAVKQLKHLLEKSVKDRTLGLKEVAVAFSGGLDSCLVALLAKKFQIDIQLIHVSLEGRPEIEEAKKAALQLNLPISVHLFTEADLENVITGVVELVEEPDPVKASVGVSFYWTSKKALEAGYHVLLAGQGADELFGGYKRYLTEYLEEGDLRVRETIFHDITTISESNIERDKKICDAFDVDLRLPFASLNLAKLALSLPTNLKFEAKADSPRKLVLRRVASMVGLPKSVAEKPKKAVQYSTGINTAMKKLAKKNNCTLREYINRIFMHSRLRHKR